MEREEHFTGGRIVGRQAMPQKFLSQPFAVKIVRCRCVCEPYRDICFAGLELNKL